VFLPVAGKQSAPLAKVPDCAAEVSGPQAIAE